MNTLLIASAAVVLGFPSAPTNGFPEATMTLPFAPDTNILHSVTFTLDFTPSPSNDVEIAFGEDTDGDGTLSLLEADLTIGCDCGGWFLSDTATGRIAEQPAPPGSPWSITLSRRRISPRWDSIRLTRRGADLANVVLTSRERHSPLLIMIR